MVDYYKQNESEYQDDIPEFQDEAEFDDFLNNEEYELMNELFPRAVKELQEYQGWDNLSVKLVIFDNEFDFHKAIIELKRRYKKKVSLLEQLANSKVAAKSASGVKPDFSVTSLEALKGCSRMPSTRYTSVTLLDVLKGKNGENNKPNIKPRGGLVSLMHDKSNLRVGPSSIPGQVNSSSLASKLSLLRSRRPRASKEQKGLSMATNNAVTKPATVDSWSAFHELSTRISAFKGSSLSYPILQITHLILSGSGSKSFGTQSGKLKRKSADLWTVYYPNKLNPAAKKQAIENFKKPSHDDIVVEHQKQAFELELVTGKVADMKVEPPVKIPTTTSKSDFTVEYEDDDEDQHGILNEEVVRKYKKSSQPTKPKAPLDLSAHLENKKPHISFVVLGHVDAGKSTLMGRLLYDVGAVDNTLIRQLKRESELAGKGSFHLAWVMDQTSEERSRGVTVDICTSYFETESCAFTVVDAPGHKDFVPNAIAGASVADVAIIVIDCGTDAFESGFNLDGQTREHILLARSLGVKNIVVAMNKMDTVEWSEVRFKEIKWELHHFFKDLGIKENDICWVPCSGLVGEGVYKTEHSACKAWYSGSSLVSELEKISIDLFKLDQERVPVDPFLFSILDVTPTNKANEVIVSGKVEAGSIQPGETITIYPSEQAVSVENIYVGNKLTPVRVAIQNDFVSLKLRNAHYEDIKGGDLASIVGFDIPITNTFASRLLTLKLDRPLLPGTNFMLFRGCSQYPARVKSLLQTVDKINPSKVLKKKVKHLGSNQAALVSIEILDNRLPMLTAGENKRLGRILLRKDGKTIGAGIIMSLDS